MLSFIVLVAILVVDIGVLAAIKRGFNEVIRGLPSLTKSSTDYQTAVT